jgi:hypothetical protein
VITVAGGSDKVAGLVYVAGVAPDEGEPVNDLQGRFPPLAMGPLVRPASSADGSVEVSSRHSQCARTVSSNPSAGTTATSTPKG